MHYLSLLFFVFLFVHLTGERATAKLYGFDAFWQVTEQNTDDEEENISAFNQRYHLQWTPRITRALSMDADMNYSRNWTTGSGTREVTTPSLDMLLQNDIFLMEFNGSVSENRNTDRRDQSRYTWETLLQSNWKYLYWPTLRLLVGQNQVTDESFDDDEGRDSDRKWYEGVIQWELDTLETYYSYYSQNRTDSAERSEYDEGRHFGRIDYSRLFHGNRGQFSISQQITDSETDFTAAVGEGERIDIAVSRSQGLAGIDPDPEVGALPANPGLIDGNRNSPAFVIHLQESANLGIKVDLQRVDVLYVYTGELDPLVVNETGNLRWDMYTSQNGIDWQRERINPSTVYNRDEFRYEVDVSGTESVYLKLVVTGWPVTVSIPVAEMEAFRTETGTGSEFAETQSYEKYLTDLNVSYAPTANTRASYSLVWDTDHNNPGNDRDRLFQAGSFRWLYSKYFIPTLTVNETTENNTETFDTRNRSYGINVRSTPLPTLDTTLGITRNESYEDDEAVSRNHAINWFTSAVLYPNLESTLDCNVIFNDNDASDQSSRAYGIRWSLNSRPRPGLLADLTTEYTVNTRDLAEITSEEDSGGRTTLDINYRASDRLSVLFNGTLGYGEKWDDYRSILFNVDFAVLRTAKTRILLGYRLNANQDDTINNFNCNWSWNISPYFTFQSYASYLITDDDNIWALNVRLTAGF